MSLAQGEEVTPNLRGWRGGQEARSSSQGRNKGLEHPLCSNSQGRDILWFYEGGLEIA